MSQWVRLWEDMPTDPKWRVVARRAGRPLAEVLAVFVFMLTNASKAQERGTLANWNDEDVGAAIDVDAEHVAAIREAMQGKTLDGDKLTGWERRQPKREDGAAERAKEWRKNNRTQPNATERAKTPREDTDTDTEKKESANAASSAPAGEKSSFEQECRNLVGEEPVLLALDFYCLERLVSDGTATADDVKAGIAAAMAKPNFRIRHWSQLEGWARGAAKERMEGKSKQATNGYKSPVTPDKRVWLPQGSDAYEAWRAAFPGTVKGMLTSKGAEQGILMPTEYPPRTEAAA
jgi:hypothetical protein